MLAFAAPSVVPPPRTMDRTDRIGAAVMGLGALAYVVNGLVWAQRVGWQPTGHSATIMARAYDVGTIHHPWIGMATSLGSDGTRHTPDHS